MEQEKVTVSFFLDASRPSSEGQCLIKLNIYQRPTKKRYATKYHATPDEWKKITSSNLRDDELKKIKKITPAFLLDYENYMLKDGKSVSTVGIYMRAARAIINRVIDANVIFIDKYPLRNTRSPAGRNIKKR
ncbi:MAG: phage integrase SAM-like domain-containing protein [Chitinophagaceae bacterium]|nr:phage integrase SAM-like domain-containing protein [Chitinophagaceae bacterium]